MLDEKALKQAICHELMQCNMIFDRGLDEDGIKAMGLIFTRALWAVARLDRTAEKVRLAFRLYMAEGKRFPQPRDIIERLEYIRLAPRKRPQARGEEACDQTRTPGYGKLVCMALAGDVTSLRVLAQRSEYAARKLAEIDAGQYQEPGDSLAAAVMGNLFEKKFS